MHQRSELLAHIQNTNAQDNCRPFGKKIASRTNRLGITETFADPMVQKSIKVDVQLLDTDDGRIREIELQILQRAREHDPLSLHLLRSIPGVGKLLAMIIL